MDLRSAEHFVGVSIEWTLTDRYMGPNSRPAFANLLRNLGSGVLRIGGSSQDQVPFDAAAADSDGFVTPHDLARIRETLNDLRRRSWVTVLGTAMAPPTAALSVAHRRITPSRSSGTGSSRCSETTRAAGTSPASRSETSRI